MDNGAVWTTAAPIGVAANGTVRVGGCGFSAFSLAPFSVGIGPDPSAMLATATQIGVPVFSAVPWITVARANDGSRLL